MSDLWDDEDDLTEEQLSSGEQLGVNEPGQLVALEAHKNAIIRITSEFAFALKSCEDIVVAANRVFDYVPPFRTDKQSGFWKKKVIPILVRYLTQDVTARSLIIQSFGTVRDLAQVIQSAFAIVKLSKGDKIAIEFAKKNIPAALDKLENCISLVYQLDCNAIQLFAEHTEEIIKIIGPEEARFSVMKEELDGRIRELRNKQQNLISGKKKGDFEIGGDIQHLLAEKRKIEEKEQETVDTIGIEGKTLIEFLAQLRTFARFLKPVASVYSTLTSILKGIKGIVENNVLLLSSDDPVDIFLAGTLLSKQGKFLSEYSVWAQNIMKTIDDYHKLGIE